MKKYYFLINAISHYKDQFYSHLSRVRFFIFIILLKLSNFDSLHESYRFKVLRYIFYPLERSFWGNFLIPLALIYLKFTPL